VDYRDVAQGPPDILEAMLNLSGGNRKIPVIVDDGRVTIGFQGRG